MNIFPRLPFCLYCLACFFLFGEAFAGSKKLRTQVGARSYFDVGVGEITNQRYSIRQEASSFVYKKKYGLSLFSNVLFTWDAEQRFLENNRHYQIRADSLFVEWQKSVIRASLGMQQLTWGETFGLPIVDVVNPLDISQPFTVDLSELKMSVPLANLELIADNFYVQVLYNPISRRTPVPDSINGVRVVQPEPFQFLKDSEYGGRVGYLFDFGLDVKFLYYEHYSRPLRYQLELGQESVLPQLILVETKQQSFGFSASQAFDVLVFRLDTVFENGFPFRNEIDDLPVQQALLKKVQVSQRYQTIFAADYSTDAGDNYGLQYQGLGYSKLPEIEEGYHPLLHWAGIRASWNFFQGQLNLDLFGITGVNNQDLWINAQTRVHVLKRVELSVEGNLMRSKKDGNRDLFQNRSVVNTGLIYVF